MRNESKSKQILGFGAALRILEVMCEVFSLMDLALQFAGSFEKEGRRLDDLTKIPFYLLPIVREISKISSTSAHLATI